MGVVWQLFVAPWDYHGLRPTKRHSYNCYYHCYHFFLQATMDQKADHENPKTWPRFILRVDHHMCNYLTSGKRTRLAVLSSSLKVWILLKVCSIRGYFSIFLFRNFHKSEICGYSALWKLSAVPTHYWKFCTDHLLGFKMSFCLRCSIVYNRQHAFGLWFHLLI